MSSSAPSATAPLPALPHWERTPSDPPAAVREIKAALRARIAASGRTVEEVFALLERRLREEVDEITAARRRGETIWPVIDYADIEAGTVPAAALSLLRRRGCLVVRGHFDRGQALGWDRDMVGYVEGNGFFQVKNSAGAMYYTRDGQFSADQNGFVANPNGLHLQGYQADAAGNLTGQVGDINEIGRAHV